MTGTGELDDFLSPSSSKDNGNVDGKDDDDPGIDDFFTNADAQQIDQEVQDIILADEEDYEFHSIKGHEWVAGVLVLKVELTSGHNIEVPFLLLKKDWPLELARYIRNNVVEQKRGGTYELWSKKIIQSANRTVRRMRHYHNIDRIIRVRKINVKKISRNKREDMKVEKIKFGIKVPSSVREALLLDNENKNTMWADAMDKELAALDKANVFEYYPPHHWINKEKYQYAPLTMIFDVKAEDLRRKARLVAGGHVVNASEYESYASVVHARTVRLLMTIAANEGLTLITGHIGNAFLHAETKEKIYSVAGKEFGYKQKCVLVIKKALYGLVTSA